MKHWRKLVLTLALAAMMIIGVLPMSAAKFPVPELVMTEFTMNPAGTDFRGEYVEIYNASSKAIDLKQYKLAYTNEDIAFVCFDNIAKYAKGDLAAGKTEPAQTLLQPGEIAVIWIKGNPGPSNAAEQTSTDFLDSYFKTEKEVNLFICEHDISTFGSEAVEGGNFYMVNLSGSKVMELYLVRKEATAANYKDHIITGFKGEVTNFVTDSYVHLKFDETTGLTTILEITQGTRLFATIGEITDAQKVVASAAATTAATTTATPTTTAKPTTTAGTGTTPPTADRMTLVIAAGALLAVISAAAIMVSKKKAR